MPTRDFRIPQNGLFYNQYANPDYDSLLAKRNREIDMNESRNIVLRSATPRADSSSDGGTKEAVTDTLQLNPYLQQPFRFEPLMSNQPSSVVGGMFSPEISRAAEMQYLQGRQKEMRDRALAFAQLSPMQQADYGFYRGGQQLGDVVGGALGGQDPQLKLISQRQRLLSQLDRSDPESYKKIALQAQQTGDSELATLISEAGRKLELDTSLIKQRNREAKGAEPIEQIIRSGKYTPASVEAYDRSGKISDLRLFDSPDKVPADIQKAHLVAKSKGFEEGTKEYNDEIVKQLEKSTTEPSVGIDREAIAKDLFFKRYSQLTQEQVRAVEEKKRTIDKELAREGATVLPGVKGVGDLVGLRKNINDTVRPFRDAVNAAAQSIELADDVLKTGNFASAASLSRALAKASGETQLSKQDVAAFGGDPSFVGSISDIASRLGTGTPTADTTRKLRALAVLLKKKNEALEKNEIAQLQATARVSGLYTEDQIKQVFTLRGESKRKIRTTAGGISYTVDEEN
jgi:hypothetical protein